MSKVNKVKIMNQVGNMFTLKALKDVLLDII